MNRYEQLLQLLDQQEICTIDTMVDHLSISKRSIAKIIKELRRLSHRGGFMIVTINNEGYILSIKDKLRYQSFKEQIKANILTEGFDKKYRIYLILYVLLQQKEYIPLQHLAELLDVSRNTIISDLEEVKKILVKNKMHLEARKHYGIIVEGEELSYRKLFSQCMNELSESLDITQDYFEFCKGIPLNQIKEKIQEILEKFHLNLQMKVIDSILIHIQILLFRISQQNHISKLAINHEMIEPIYFKAASEIIFYLKETLGLEIPFVEIDYLASQLIGKSNATTIPQLEKNELLEGIQLALRQLDKEFSTNYACDEALEDALIYHVYPLLKRITFGLVLCDSLVDLVSMQFANSFLVALRFNEICRVLQNYKLSRDEIGYLALHFATHQEKQKQKVMEAAHHIVVIEDNNRSVLSLLKTILLSHFPNAIIRFCKEKEMNEVHFQDADVVISTKQIQNDFHRIIQIKELPDDVDIQNIRHALLNWTLTGKRKRVTMMDMFYPELFQIYDDDVPYYDCIDRMCKKMEELNFAGAHFREFVRMREEKFTTIYKNGIASPHSMKQIAKQDSIGLILLRKEIQWNHCSVKCIFLINTMQGHLFLHQEVSEFLLKLMNDSHTISRLQHAQSFDDCMKILNNFR